MIIITGIWSSIGIGKNIQEIQKVKFLEYQKNRLSAKIKKTNKEIEEIVSSLDTIYKYDNIVRFASFLFPVSKDVINAGIGGTIKEETGIGEVDELLAKINYLKRRTSVQMYYFEEAKNKVEKSIDILNKTPSIKPTKGHFLSGFGYRIDPFTRRIRMHKGLDIGGPRGTIVVAAADGVVIFRGANTGYGLMVEIDHGYGVSTIYAHLSSIKIELGQQVKRGQIIGTIGSTGRATGPHLHYEVRINGEPVNPMYFIVKD